MQDPQSAYEDAHVRELAAWRDHDRVFYEKLYMKLKEAGVRMPPLEKAINAVASGTDDPGPDVRARGDLYEHWSVEPWEDSVDTGELIAAIVEKITFTSPPSATVPTVVAIWIMFTWIHGGATHSPMLMTTSPVQDCGKSTLLGIIHFTAWRALQAISISGAVCSGRSKNGCRPSSSTRRILRSCKTKICAPSSTRVGRAGKACSAALAKIMTRGCTRRSLRKRSA